MSVLRISLFGHVRVVHAGQSEEANVTRGVQALLAYLLVQRHRPHPREVLADLFWGDRGENRARNCLNTALWRLRRVLEPDGVLRGTYLVNTPAGEVGFNRASAHWLDVDVFEEKIAGVLHHPVDGVDAAAPAELEKALELYTADLLEGFYDDWALRERERLRILHLDGLAYLMRYYRHQGAYEESLARGQQILRYDPLREEIHREVMQLYVASGQRALALRQYENCCDILATELGVLPMEATRALYAHIRPEAPGYQPATPNDRGEPATLNHALQQLRIAIQHFSSGQEQLQRAIELLEHFADQE